MSTLKNSQNLVLDVVDSWGRVVNQFDLERENIGGVFPSLALLSLALMSLTANRTLLRPTKHFKEEYDYIIGK